MSDTSAPVATGGPTPEADMADPGAARDDPAPPEEPPASKSSGSEWNSLLRQVSGKDILGFLGVVGLAVYGSVRFADTVFYARLGTTPDSVGISYSETLSRVAGPVALLTALVLTTALCVRLKGSLSLFLMCLMAAITVISLGVLLPLPQVRLFGRSLVPIILTLLIIFLAAGKSTRYVAFKEGVQKDKRWLLVLLGFALVIVFGLAGITGYREAGYLLGARWDAQTSPLPCGCVQYGGYDLSFPWLGGSQGFYGIEAQPVTVQWVGSGPKPKALPETVFYLGESDGIDVLFDPGSNQSVSVPAISVLLTAKSVLKGFNER